MKMHMDIGTVPEPHMSQASFSQVHQTRTMVVALAAGAPTLHRSLLQVVDIRSDAILVFSLPIHDNY